MDTKQIHDKFEMIGARVKFGAFQGHATNIRPRLSGQEIFVSVEDGKVKLTTEPPKSLGVEIAVDVRNDPRGEHFVIEATDTVSVSVMDARPALRHLLLFVKSPEQNLRFLCGHDETQWYVAAVPDGDSPASNIASAMEALKPEPVKRVQQMKRVRKDKRNKRKNQGFIRQGEWFFVREEPASVDSRVILKKEPLSRGAGSKPHVVEELFRMGGDTVYVCGALPQGITEEQRSELFKTVSAEFRPVVMTWRWTVMKRNPQVYARGKVWHNDHRTIVLKDWHRVFMNTENKSPARKHVVFLD